MDVTQFLDYRALIRLWLVEHPRTSQNALAKRVGLSPSMLSQMLAGERDLDPSRVRRVAQGLGFDEPQTAYLAALVDVESSVLQRRQSAMALILAHRRFGSAGRLGDEDVRVLSHWTYGAVWQLAHCVGFRADPQWICAHLVPTPAVEEVHDALDGLVALELLVPDGNGSFAAAPEDRVTQQHVPRGALARALRAWHRWHLRNVSEALETVTAADRHVSGVTVAVSAERLALVRERVRAFEREVAALASAGGGPPDRVVHLEIALVPLSRPTGS